MIIDELARYAHSEAGRALPAEVTHHAKRALRKLAVEKEDQP